MKKLLKKHSLKKINHEYRTMHLLRKALLSFSFLLCLISLHAQGSCAHNTEFSFGFTGTAAGAGTNAGEGTVQQWTVPTGVTSVSIRARGARGGAHDSFSGGRGASITGTFTVTPGDVLHMIVGGTGGDASPLGGSGGGGGGTFVSNGPIGTGTLFMVAAGGGGAGFNGGGGSAGIFSGTGLGSATGGAGGGNLTMAGNDANNACATGGLAMTNTGFGSANACVSVAGAGGYGGGGSGGNSSGGGGGGGFTGGNGGPFQGGNAGSSFILGGTANPAAFHGGFDGSVRITVLDIVAPVAACLNPTIMLDANGNATLSVTDVNDNSMDADNCSALSFSLSQTSFDCADVGPNTVTLTLTDANNNSDNCDATVTVADGVLPTMLCQDATIILDASGNAAITTADIDNGSNDACGIATLTLDDTDFGCEDITPTEPTAPTTVVRFYRGRNVTFTNVNINGTGNNVLTVAPGAPVNVTTDFNSQYVTDFCPGCIVQYYVGIPGEAIECMHNGNASSTFNSNGSLNFTAPTTPGVYPIQFTGSLQFSCTETADDLCDTPVEALGFLVVAAQNTVTLTATDNNGNSNTCTASVTVQDNIAPVANCPTDAPIVELNGAGRRYLLKNALVSGNSTDNCTVTESSIITLFECDDIGTQQVELLVFDEGGNTTATNCDVIVQDNIAPVAVCPTNAPVVQLDADGNGTLAVNALVAGNSTDNCSVTETSPLTNFTCAEVGTQMVVLTATDSNTTPNVTTINCSVTIEDNVNPEALCQDITVQLDANGNGGTTAAAVDNGSNDACGIASLALNQTDFVCSNVGGNAVTLTVTDNNDKVSTCPVTVTVEDNVAPNVITQDIVVELDNEGNVTITATDIDNGTTDACGIASMSLDFTAFNCGNVGANTVNLSVTDVNGNTASESAIVTIVDLLPAEIECRQPVSTVVTPGACGKLNLSVLSPFVLYDNCGIDAGISISRTPAITDYPIGTTVLTWTVTDSNGNDATCESLVIVEDNEAPIVNSCNTIIDFLDPNSCSAQVTVEVETIDNCGIESIEGAGTFNLPIGIHPQVITITDVNGNVTLHDITVYVHDDQAPELVSCPEDFEIIANQGENIVDLPEPIFTDNCGISELINDAPEMFAEGTTVVTWTAQDLYGNTTDCSYDVTVTPSIFFTGEESPIEASSLEEGGSSMVTWNRPEAITHCEACLVTDMPDFIFLGEFEGHQYFLYPNAANWTDAVVLSEEINAQLVTINDVRENDFIQNQLPITEEEVHYWTGLSYQNYDFAWLTDATFDYGNFGFDPVLNFDVINAGIMNADGTWAMMTADMENGFLAERPCLDVKQIAPIIETGDENGEIIETLLTPDADWAAGEYTVIYEATDMCDSTAAFSFGVTVQEPTAIYCQTSGLDQDVWLDRVAFNDYMNESENNAGYEDYTEESVELLSTHPVNIQLIPGGIDLEENETPLYWRIFADWNNDGDFFDAGEILHEETSVNIVNLELPAILNEEDLSVTMRIAIAKGAYPEACADYTTGEVEDYALFFPTIEEEEEETNENGFTLYPNPASNNVTIDLTDFVETAVSINITNNIGKVQHQQTIDAVKQKNLRVDLRGLNNGIYFVNIRTAKGEIITERLVVTRMHNWTAKK